MEIITSLPARLPLNEVAGWARRVEDIGFDVLHIPETIHDAFTVAALALANTSRLVVRTSMVVAFPRSPMLTAYAAWDLVSFSDGRFQLGVASQIRGNVVGRFSTEWSEPVSRLGDYVGALRMIFCSFQTGAELAYDGTHYRFHRLQPYFSPGPLEHPSPPIWTGGVNRRMCMLAGELSDGFVCHPTNSHPEVLRQRILPAISAGRSGRVYSSAGPRMVACPQVLMAPTHDEVDQAREQRRSELAFLYSTPEYRPQLAMFGLEDVGEALTAMARRGDWADLRRQLDDDIVNVLLPQGTYDELPAVLRNWYAGLCDGIVLSPPSMTEDHEALSALVTRCRTIPTTGQV